MVMKAFKKDTNDWVRIGDEIESYRGEKAILGSCTKPANGPTPGKIFVKYKDSNVGAELYDTVFGLEVREV